MGKFSKNIEIPQIPKDQHQTYSQIFDSIVGDQLKNDTQQIIENIKKLLKT